MDDEQVIFEDFRDHSLTIIEAIERLERCGYSPREAEELAYEWVDGLEAARDSRH